jgi:hypothetical protein
MVHTHFLFYLYHLGIIHASVCIFSMWSIQGLLCVPIGYLIDAYLYVNLVSIVCHNARGMS